MAGYCIYNNLMKITFDPNKDGINQAKHGISLSCALNLEWESALLWPDNRRDYGEMRQCALAYIGQRLYHVSFVKRHGALRIISLRKANKREVRRYAEA